MRHKSFFILFCILIISTLFGTHSVYSGNMDVTSFTTMSGDCTSSTVIGHNFTIEGQTDDTGTGRDGISLVIYDGNGNAFAYIGIGVAVGYTGNITDFSWNYPFLSQPLSRPFTIRIFDTTIPVATVDANIIGAQQGTIIDVIQFDPVDYSVCTHLPMATIRKLTSFYGW